MGTIWDSLGCIKISEAILKFLVFMAVIKRTEKVEIFITFFVDSHFVLDGAVRHPRESQVAVPLARSEQVCPKRKGHRRQQEHEICVYLAL